MLRRSWLSATAVLAASGNAPSPRRLPERGAVRQSEESATTPVDARISARCTVRTPVRCRDRPPPMCMRQDESPAAQISAPVDRTLAHLVGQHRRRHLGVLDRERAAEAAALVGAGSSTRSRPRTWRSRRSGLSPTRASAASGRSGGRSPGAGSTRRRPRRRARRPGTRTARRSWPRRPRPARPGRRRRPDGPPSRAGGAPNRRTTRTGRRRPRTARRSRRSGGPAAAPARG